MQANLIPDLTDLAREYIHFSNSDIFGGAFQASGTWWTIAGMVGANTGLPLKTPFKNSMGLYENFLPGAYSLGKILEEEGYNQTLVIGSEAEFGGRDSFFKQHGNFVIKDVTTAEQDGIIPEDYYVWWGFEDKRLYEYAKQELQQLTESDKPFNLTLLTADTHFQDGFVCELCREDFPTQYDNVIACGSRQVYDFVSWIQSQDFYENTTIVIIGDHLTMQPESQLNLYSESRRSIYNVIINSVAETDNTKNRIFSIMDFFPTTLAAMGVYIEGDRLGLGTNLFSSHKTLPEIFGEEEFNYQLSLRSRFYNSMLRQ
jgi:phosphoglycerol transferase